MKPLYIFDIDGTIANLEHRLHYIQGQHKDWDAFHMNASHDRPIYPNIHTLKILKRNADIWFFTGRMDYIQDITEQWIMQYIPSCFHELNRPNVTMRKTKDYRPDYEIKQEMLNNMLNVDQHRLVAVFDDRQQVVNMWRKHGITCYQVADGNF